jgi:hypothetical protein
MASTPPTSSTSPNSPMCAWRSPSRPQQWCELSSYRASFCYTYAPKGNALLGRNSNGCK